MCLLSSIAHPKCVCMVISFPYLPFLTFSLIKASGTSAPVANTNVFASMLACCLPNIYSYSLLDLYLRGRCCNDILNFSFSITNTSLTAKFNTLLLSTTCSSTSVVLMGSLESLMLLIFTNLFFVLILVFSWNLFLLVYLSLHSQGIHTLTKIFLQITSLNRCNLYKKVLLF